MMYAVDRDEDFSGIFIQEAKGVLETLDKRLPAWKNKPADGEALAEIRRSFHTLKGSGRMVKALDLAEVAWKVENMLNRVIDGTIQATDSVVDVVVNVRALIPSMLTAFEKSRPLDQNSGLEELMAQADELAGQTAPQSPTQAKAPTTRIRGNKQNLALELVKLSLRLDRIQKRSDESLHRSEMALQHTRRVGGHFSAIKAELNERARRADIESVIDQVNALAEQFDALNREVASSSGDKDTEDFPQRLELNQLIDQLVRERTTPLQRRRGELERQLGEARRDAASARNLARWALAVSALASGGVAATLLLGISL